MKKILWAIIISVAILVIVGMLVFYVYNSKMEEKKYYCNSNQDCEIRNIGNACGYYPECVSINFKPFPSIIKIESGSSNCGFPSINYCECLDNSCIARFDPNLPEWSP